MEVPQDPYVPLPPGGRVTSPAVGWSRGGYVSVQVNVDADGNNILGDAANEPSIAVDPTSPTKMVIGWRQFDTITSNFRQAGWGYTADAGQTWTFPGVIEPGVFRSDPVLDADHQGYFYYNSLTANASHTDFWCHVFRSFDGGVTWDSGTYAFGGDKQWQVIDITDGIGQGNIYACWNEVFSSCNGDFTRSTDGGETFPTCTHVPTNPYWGTLAVGPDGELYECGTGFTIVKSTTMQDPLQPPQWDFATTMSLGGSIEFSAGPNPGGLLGQAWIAVDHSPGADRGNVYLLCSVDPSGADPLDVMFSRSVDGGVTWSAPVRVNDDPVGNGAWQWFGTMSVAPNGRIDAIWNDTRNDPGGYDSEVHYSFSTDAGVTWSPNEVLTPSFDPHVGWPQQNKIGDYYDMVSDDFGANLAYSATFNGEQDVYFLRIGDPACPDAGTVALDRAKYACESTANIVVLDCGLNLDDNVVETVSVTIESDSEPAGESVLLVESSPATAQFLGSIALS
ncbi:MAG: sialidase family protein, partial [Planctomycetota bacterium]